MAQLGLYFSAVVLDYVEHCVKHIADSVLGAGKPLFRSLLPYKMMWRRLAEMFLKICNHSMPRTMIHYQRFMMFLFHLLWNPQMHNRNPAKKLGLIPAWKSSFLLTLRQFQAQPCGGQSCMLNKENSEWSSVTDNSFVSFAYSLRRMTLNTRNLQVTA